MSMYGGTKRRAVTYIRVFDGEGRNITIMGLKQPEEA
jgi:hypothetical protein